MKSVKKINEKTIGRKRGYFELAICSKYDKNYWLFIEVKETATLKDIDDFLRDIWVECCGHLSEFDIDGVSYQSDLGVVFSGMNLQRVWTAN